MKGTPQPPQTPAAAVESSYNEGNTTANDSEDERWDDKLVIDLDASGTSSSDKAQAKITATTMEVDESNTSNIKDASEQSNAASSAKNGRSENNTLLGKPKGKRGQKKANDINATASFPNAKSGSKTAKPEKEKPVPAKPGRKKKEKFSPPPIKTEADSKPDDPYKFDPNDEKIASTAIGKIKSKIKGEPKVTKDAQTDYDWRSVAVITEPENLGPCEPGTQVCLEGIVWQETNNGVLVVNVTWKGKTYMGTLLDATKHDWSPPSCDSPTGDFEGRTPKGRGKRSRVPLSDTFKDINERKLRKEMRKQSSQNQGRPKSPACSPKSENGKRKGRSSECDGSEPASKRGRATSNNSANCNPQSPPTLIECLEPNCGKKYKQMSGLKYHQRSAHPESSSQAPSDTTSEGPDKAESVSSPEESSKLNVSNSDGKPQAEITDEDSKDVAPDTSTPEIPTKSFSVKNNTTSVITPTTTSFTNTSAPQASNVPIATITPQVVKPSSSPGENEQTRSNSNTITSTANRMIAISGPPKLISKPSANNSAMAPISTITSPNAYSSTLKPIQPKPTILGGMTPDPGLHDLKDQKKLKRRRSASKEELINPPAYPNVDVQRPQQQINNIGMHKFETEHRGLLSTGGMINMAETPNILQSPSYSDISEEGEIKNAAARRELLSVSRNDGNMYSQPPYLVATVSPQKNAPLLENDSKSVINRRTPSHSPVPSRNSQQEKQKQMQQYLASQHTPWVTMNPELFHPQMLHMQSSAKDKSLSRTISPKPNSFKSSGPPPMRDIDSRTSNDQLQLLKENMEMKTSPMLSRLGLNDTPRDYSLSPNTQSQQSHDFMMYAEKRELEQQDHHKREMMKNISPANKMTSSSSKQSDPRYEKMSRASPMPPPPGSFPPSFMSNAFLPFGFAANPMLAGRQMQPIFPGFALPNISSMSMDNKDGRNSGSPSYGGKSGHKIHELADGMQSSKSPRPASSADRQMASKTQTITSQSAAMHSAAAAAMLGSYGHPGLHPGMAALYPPPK